jgi:hypothetical protein
MRAVLWGRTQLVRLEHLPATRETRIVARHGERLLCVVKGHPTEPETHERLAEALRHEEEAIRRDVRALRPLAPETWRKPAA